MCLDDRVTLGHLTRCTYDCMYVLHVRLRTYCGNTMRMNVEYKHVTWYIHTTICGIFLNCHLLQITRGLLQKIPICVGRVCKWDLIIWNPLNLVYHIYHIHKRGIPYSYAWLTHVWRIWIIIYTTFEWYPTHIWRIFEWNLTHIWCIWIMCMLMHIWRIGIISIIHAYLTPLNHRIWRISMMVSHVYVWHVTHTIASNIWMKLLHMCARVMSHLRIEKCHEHACTSRDDRLHRKPICVLLQCDRL